MIRKLRLGIIFMGCISTDLVFAGTVVPEMDVAGVPVVIGLTIAVVMLVKDRLGK